ncbi:hypothetical protein GCM10025868_32110 [Angustibacter aerolatus]|uniref:Uncharacterized protein n=1 Tax=Angustibacter aerolatus TaxID=1162965 RepID=A0ABQ6JK64_9ACTN|nr:hypothetical protein GCM10025868_32110 [Angustibacter aerolatus]
MTATSCASTPDAVHSNVTTTVSAHVATETPDGRSCRQVRQVTTICGIREARPVSASGRVIQADGATSTAAAVAASTAAYGGRLRSRCGPDSTSQRISRPPAPPKTLASTCAGWSLRRP